MIIPKEPKQAPYVIPSHTSVKNREVTFKDLEDSIGKDKSGYSKLRFCADQAKQDGLRHFSVDSCYIAWHIS